MPEQNLDDTDVGVLLQQVRGEPPGCDPGVWRHALLDACGLGGGTDGAAELADRQRLYRVAAGKQSPSRQRTLRRRPSRHQARSARAAAATASRGGPPLS